MRMYVWYPESLTDYSSGMVCAIAESKRAAIELAVEERCPYYTSKQYKKLYRPALTLVQINANILAERDKFRTELTKDKPKVIRRGAVHIAGGG